MRSIRRHHRARLKASRRFHFGRDLRLEPKTLSRVVDTPCPCSCWGCGNPRRNLGERSLPERIADDRRDEINDLWLLPSNPT